MEGDMKLIGKYCLLGSPYILYELADASATAISSYAVLFSDTASG